jgi:hypothetical protein
MKSIDIRLDRPYHIPCFDLPLAAGQVLEIREDARVYRGKSILDVALSGDGIDLIPKKVGTAFVEVSALDKAERLRVNVVQRAEPAPKQMVTVEKWIGPDGKWTDGRYCVRDSGGRIVADNFKSRKQAVEWANQPRGRAEPRRRPGCKA